MKIQSIIHYGTGIGGFADDNKGFRRYLEIETFYSLNNTNRYHQLI